MSDLIASVFGDAEALKAAEILADENFPIFLTRHGPALWPKTDPAAGPPAIILSVPKSGTYFTEALFKRMGYQAVYVHAMTRACNDWRFENSDRDDIQLAGRKVIPLTILSRLVLPGQIIVSHAGRDPAIEAALRHFKKIYLYRDLREVFVSHARAEAGGEIAAGELTARVTELCRSRGDDLKSVIETVSAWRDRPDVLAVDFNELTSPEPGRQEALAARFERFMGWPKAAVIAALQAVPGDETPTRVDGPRSSLDGVWDEPCEAWFREHMAEVRVAPDSVIAGS